MMDGWEKLIDAATQTTLVHAQNHERKLRAARIRAAAPDLLEACRAALWDFEDSGGPSGTINLLEAAIAKAEGSDA